jgi:hypothetical protein
MTFALNEYQFENISAQKGVNIKYFQDVLKLINKHKNNLLDDYLPSTPEGVIELIDSLFPWFFIVLKNDRFLGFFYCHNWYGNKDKLHSCYLTAASTKEAYGKDTRKALTLFCNYLYDAIGIIKIKAEVCKNNRLCINILENTRFKKEGYLKSNTMINNQLQDMLVYSKVNPRYLKNINNKKEVNCELI